MKRRLFNLLAAGSPVLWATLWVWGYGRSDRTLILGLLMILVLGIMALFVAILCNRVGMERLFAGIAALSSLICVASGMMVMRHLPDLTAGPSLARIKGDAILLE